MATATTEAPARARAQAKPKGKALDETGPLGRFGKSALLGIIFLWCLFPFAWLIGTSLKDNASLVNPNPFAGALSIDNYRAVFDQGFVFNLRNSLIVAGMTTIICVVIGALAGYAIARLKLKRKALVLAGVLVVSLFPPVALVPPLFTFWNTLGLLNTYPSMYISYIAFNLPLTIFILVTFFAAIPIDLEEAARVDGASPFQAFWRVVMPLAAPGVGAAAILIFTYAWNEFLLASAFAPRDLAVQTVPVAIANFTGVTSYVRPVGAVTAACVIVTVPMIIFVLVFQKKIVAGLTAGGVKG
ncbi:carbohydrate ABC transporter permease [soil metagenome]|jgi:multiple sugar transport system permease protein